MKLTYALLAAVALSAHAVSADCNCQPEDSACIEKCVTSVNGCVEACKNDTTCFQNCVKGWPGVDITTTASGSATASGSVSPTGTGTPLLTSSTASVAPSSANSSPTRAPSGSASSQVSTTGGSSTASRSATQTPANQTPNGATRVSVGLGLLGSILALIALH
ncbi:hypothetical protein EC973_001134 [Apophysomyces ossiformis]|uniref:GPI anchored serine-threonine rich protein n=1 Tax=Apophysomyces ossiformis TaxID=679940 RepID=A0A8H7ENS6_9FUNG|nr:hypothetical protein EC973_001134 [Apophysomyces ossiformis]